jgi:hypothetical protein
MRERAVPFEPLDPSELIWGGRAIARAIGRTEAATFHSLERGRVPGARGVGGRWALHVPSFRAAFESARTCTPGDAPHGLPSEVHMVEKYTGARDV